MNLATLVLPRAALADPELDDRYFRVLCCVANLCYRESWCHEKTVFAYVGKLLPSTDLEDILDRLIALGYIQKRTGMGVDGITFIRMLSHEMVGAL